MTIAFPELKYAAVGMAIGFFILYTWQRILSIIIFTVLAFIAVRMFPILAPVAFILMVIIFLARISYIIKNWRAVLAGFFMYALAIGFAFYGQMIQSLMWMYFGWLGFIFYNLFPSPYNWTIENSFFASVIAFIGTWTFNRVILWLYSHHYSLAGALSIMGMAPLLIALLFLPFLKAVDVIDGAFTGDAMDSADTFHADSADTFHADSADTVHASDAVRSGDGIHSPGTHYTHGYLRTGASGDVHYVRGYEATNPDGIVENNYSAHGISSTRGEPIPYTPASSSPHMTENELADDIPYVMGSKKELKKENKETLEKE